MSCNKEKSILVGKVNATVSLIVSGVIEVLGHNMTSTILRLAALVSAICLSKRNTLFGTFGIDHQIMIEQGERRHRGLSLWSLSMAKPLLLFNHIALPMCIWHPITQLRSAARGHYRYPRYVSLHTAQIDRC
jgi:hypothetical protein